MLKLLLLIIIISGKGGDYIKYTGIANSVWVLPVLGSGGNIDPDVIDGWNTIVKNSFTFDVIINTQSPDTFDDATTTKTVQPDESAILLVNAGEWVFDLIDSGTGGLNLIGQPLPNTLPNNYEVLGGNAARTAWEYRKIWIDDFIPAAITSAESPYRGLSGQALAIDVSGNNIIIDLPLTPIDRDVYRIFQLNNVGVGTVTIRDVDNGGITLIRSDGSQVTDTELVINQSITVDFYWGGTKWWVHLNI